MEGQSALLFHSLTLAFLFTSLLVIIQLLHGAACSLRALLSLHTLIYLLIFVIGNFLATILANYHLKEILTGELAASTPFLSAFAGVFAFQFVLGNTNISIYHKDVLTIDDWITKARQLAIQRAIERQIELDDAALIINTNRLSELEEEQLNLYIKTHLDESIEELEQEAGESHIPANKYKGMILASSLSRSQLKAILNHPG